MKKNITMLAVALIGTLAIFSCKKKDNSPTYSMTANIGSSSFSAANTYATDTAGIFEVFGSSSSTFPAIDIIVSNYTGVGTYQLSDTSSNSAIIDSSLTNYIGATSGTITIATATSTMVTGTFSFTCNNADSTKVTNGSFSSKLQ